MFTIKFLHNFEDKNAQCKGCKRAPGRLQLDNLMRWFWSRMNAQQEISFAWFQILFCITGFSLLLWWTMGASECPRFIIVFQNVNLWISKFNHHKVSLHLWSRNMILISWKPIEVWFTSKCSPWLDCSADKKIDWSHDQSIIRLWSFYTIFKLKSIGCFICQFRN